MVRRRSRSEDSDLESIAPQSLTTELERLSIALSKTTQNIIEELGSSCSGSSADNNDDDVPDGEDPFDNATIDSIRDLIAQGNSLSKTPWGTNAMENRSYYIADTGHKYVVKPKSKGGSKEAVDRVTAFLTKWTSETQWGLRQGEVSQRLDRTGECLDLLHYSEDGMLRLDFVEPADLEDDPNSQYQDAQDEDKPWVDDLGVRRSNDILFRREAYFIDGGNQRGIWLGDLEAMRLKSMRLELIGNETGSPRANFDAYSPEHRSVICYRRRNVISSEPRGLHLYYSSRRYLRWATVLLQNLMRVSGFQAAFGAIRTIMTAATTDQVKAYLNSQQSGKVGSTPETYDMPAPGVVTKGANVSYEFPETGAGNSNHIEVLVQLLRACSSGMRLPEFMLTSNVSEGNFASTLVSEGPFHKGMKKEQSMMTREDEAIIWQALYWAAESGDHELTMEDLLSVTIETRPPRVQTRNRQEDFDIGYKLWEARIISGKTLAAQEGHEYDEEQAQIAVEAKNEHQPPAIANVTPPGPAPGSNADPLKEKGVLSGDPGRNPPA